MSQTLLAPSPVAIRPLGAEDLRPSAHDAGAPLPFARPQAVTPGGWIAGLVFGLVCLGAGAVLAVACLLAALALGVVGLLRSGDGSRRWSPGRPRP